MYIEPGWLWIGGIVLAAWWVYETNRRRTADFHICECGHIHERRDAADPADMIQ